MMRSPIRPLLLLLLASTPVWSACGAPPRDQATTAAAGEPLPGLDAALRARFYEGRALFNTEFTPETGLGPLFNQTRCSSCHDLPTLGGAGVERVIKATRFEPPDTCDPLAADGGDMFQQRSTPAAQALGIRHVPVPPHATAVVEFTGPPLYGAGLIEAIPDAEILARADPDDADGDGIRGLPGRAADGRLGRFGRRAEFADLTSFTARALLLEMGLTTTYHPEELHYRGAPLPPETDPAPDPEIGDDALAAIVDYLRLLALPARETATGPRADTLARGERSFRDIGCYRCHTPALRTGRSHIPALDRRLVPLYSNLLLHDMGPDFASVCVPGLPPAAFRTAPLVGLRLRPSFLHDGRALTIDLAIRMHGGEAEPARRRYERLPDAHRRALLAWLHSL